MKGDDKAAIEARTKDLTDASGKMAERMYAAKAAEQGQAGAQAEQAAGGAGGAEAGAKKEDVVDAEFEEVKDKK